MFFETENENILFPPLFNMVVQDISIECLRIPPQAQLLKN